MLVYLLLPFSAEVYKTRKRIDIRGRCSNHTNVVLVGRARGECVGIILFSGFIFYGHGPPCMRWAEGPTETTGTGLEETQ